MNFYRYTHLKIDILSVQYCTIIIHISVSQHDTVQLLYIFLYRNTILYNYYTYSISVSQHDTVQLLYICLYRKYNWVSKVERHKNLKSPVTITVWKNDQMTHYSPAGGLQPASVKCKFMVCKSVWCEPVTAWWTLHC